MDAEATSMQLTPRRLLAGAAIFLLAVLPKHGVATDFLGAGFEEFTGIPAHAAAVIDDDELDELRGGFLGFFFSVTFKGVVDLDGRQNGILVVDAGLGEQRGNLVIDGSSGGLGAGNSDLNLSVTDGSGEVVTSASVGDAFRGSSGVFQITQVPGNENFLQQALVINLAIIQADEGRVSALRTELAPLFGL